MLQQKLLDLLDEIGRDVTFHRKHPEGRRNSQFEEEFVYTLLFGWSYFIGRSSSGKRGPFHKGFINRIGVNHHQTWTTNQRLLETCEFTKCKSGIVAVNSLVSMLDTLKDQYQFALASDLPKRFRNIQNYPEPISTVLPHQKRYAEGSIIRRCGSPPLFPLLSPFPWLFGNRPRTQGNLSSRLD